MSDSIWNDPRITAYILDELSEDERNAFELELARDAELVAAVKEARSVTGKLERLFAAESTQTLEDERRQAIVTGEVSANGATLAPAPARSWRTPLIALATAASLLALIGGPMLMNRSHEMVLGQADTDAINVATEQELRKYGKESAKNTALDVSDRSMSIDDVIVGNQPNIDWEEAELDNSALAPRVYSGRASRQAPVEVSARGRVSGQPSDSFRRNENLEIAQSESKRKQNAAGAAGARSQARSQPKSLAAPALAQSAPALTPSAAANEPTRASREMLGGRALDESKVRIKNRLERSAAISVDANESEAIDQPVPESNVDTFTFEGQRVIKQAARSRVIPGRMLNRVPSLVQGPELFGEADADGIGPGRPGDNFEPITDNPFQRVAEHAVSTFSVDVDTASYSKTRDFLTRANQLPRPDAVRIEELINYFDYDYQAPTADDKHPFTTHTLVTSCPWNKEHRLARIALKGKVIENKERPQCNLVFLLDTSGSMNAPNKLPLVIEGMQMLLNQLGKQDRVAITVYAGSAGLVLDSTPAKKKGKIRKALTQLNAGGSTNGGAGIALAYQTARDNFIEGGVNRVILCTDGDFNVGTTGTDALVRMVEQEAKGGIFLSVLAFGMGNHNDSMLEQISGRGNGNYAFIDNQKEARKVLVNQTNSTLVTIAKDVKLQIEFNPNKVSSYRLIGYENRVLAKEDFNDDKKDAGEIGAGHAVTALYEIVPVGVEADESRPKADELKYQSKPEPTDAADSDEMMTLKLRYKAPDGDDSTLVEFPVIDAGGAFNDADEDVRFTVAVAGFGMQLRRSEYKGTWTLSDVRRVAEGAKGEDESGLRTEFIGLVQKASELMGQE